MMSQPSNKRSIELDGELHSIPTIDDNFIRTERGSSNDKANGDGEESRTETELSSVPVYSVFTKELKLFIVLMTVFGSIFSPFSSLMYLPAVTSIAESYGRTIGEINLSITVFQIMQAIAPLIFGDLSDQIGRRPIYVVMFVVYLGSNVGLALQNNYAALMLLRALQSISSSAPLAIGNAVIVDMTTAAERGGYITAVLASIQFAPALAPAVGGILIKYWGWSSTFWFLVITAGVFLVVYVPFVPEVNTSLGGTCVCICCELTLPLDGPQCSRQWLYPFP
jgi:multidrug resistance protein